MAAQSLRENADFYADTHGLNITGFLGGGQDGSVWKTDRQSALKAFERDSQYRTELACYQQLERLKIRNVCGLAVPRLLGFDGDYRVVEMGIVSRPCLIDFGKAYLGDGPDHSAETLRYHRDEQLELWGDHYSRVQTVLWYLRKKVGITYCDPKPGNIMFEDWDYGD
jgi:hypothetical protein